MTNALRDRTVQFLVLMGSLGACGKQTLESGALGNADADAQADSPAALTCTKDGTVYPESAAVPGVPGCYDCQCLHGSVQCPLVICLPKRWCAITATLKRSNPDAGLRSGPDLPAHHQFSLLIDWSSKTVTTGSGGSANRASLTSQTSMSDGEWFTQGNLDLVMTLDRNWSADRTFAAEPMMRYQQMVIQRTTDGCVGRATGNYMVADLDILYNVPFEADLVGTIDQSGPSFTVFPKQQTELHPLDVQGVAANELLPVHASARLLNTEGASVPLSPLPVGSTVGISGFVLDKRALAFGTTYQFEVTPAVDLAGYPAAQLPSLTTRTGPGFFAQDGFEGPVDALLGGQVKVIDATALTVPTGKRALRFAPVSSSAPDDWTCDDRFTARLSVPPAAKSVKLSALSYNTGLLATGVFYGWLRLAVPNGAMTEDHYWMPSNGELKQVELPLPEGVGSEVIFDLYRPCSEPQLSGAGLILDDLRVE